MLHLPARAASLVVTVGLGELPELIRQSKEYAEAWQKRGLPGRYLPVDRHDHFSILEGSRVPTSGLGAVHPTATPARGSGTRQRRIAWG